MSLDSVNEWILWIMELGGIDVLWYIPWYRMNGVMPSSSGQSLVHLLGFTHSTWYCANRVQRQMGIDQTKPLFDGLTFDVPITAGVVRATLSSWIRGYRLVHPLPDPTSVQTSSEYQDWLKTFVWPLERLRRVTLLGQVEGWGKDSAEEEDVPTLAQGEEVEEKEAASPEKEIAPRRKRA